MNLPSSLFVSCVIVAVIWFGVAYQPGQDAYAYPDSEASAATAPSDWSEASRPEDQISASIVQETAAVEQTAVVEQAAAGVIAQANVSKAPAANSIKHAANSPESVSRSREDSVDFKTFESLEIVGITQEINLDGVDAMWAEFGNRSDLHNRLSKMTATNYVLYRNFNGDFSREKITIGYDSDDLNSMGKDVVSAPDGRYRILRKPDRYSQQELLDSWTMIDFQRPVEALLERHVLNASAQVVSSSIYVLYR